MHSLHARSLPGSQGAGLETSRASWATILVLNGHSLGTHGAYEVQRAVHDANNGSVLNNRQEAPSSARPLSCGGSPSEMHGALHALVLQFQTFKQPHEWKDYESGVKDTGTVYDGEPTSHP